LEHSLLFSWAIWFVLSLHLVGFFFIFGFLSKTIGMSIIEAMEKKTHNKAISADAKKPRG
jgi:hypothetical protein